MLILFNEDETAIIIILIFHYKYFKITRKSLKIHPIKICFLPHLTHFSPLHPYALLTIPKIQIILCQVNRTTSFDYLLRAKNSSWHVLATELFFQTHVYTRRYRFVMISLTFVLLFTLRLHTNIP